MKDIPDDKKVPIFSYEPVNVNEYLKFPNSGAVNKTMESWLQDHIKLPPSNNFRSSDHSPHPALLRYSSLEGTPVIEAVMKVYNGRTYV